MNVRKQGQNTKSFDESKVKQKGMGDKLKNEESAAKARRKKLRYGKKDNSLTPEEQRKLNKLKRQGRKKIYKQEAINKKLRDAMLKSQNAQREAQANVSTETSISVLQSAITSVEMAGKLTTEQMRLARYGEKLHEQEKLQEKVKHGKREHNQSGSGATGQITSGEVEGLSNAKSRQLQRERVKKEIQTNARRNTQAGAAKGTGKASSKAAEKTKDTISKLGEFLAEHSKGAMIVLAIALILMILMDGCVACGASLGSMSDVSIVTSYTAKDRDIINTDKDYKELEKELQKKIDRVEIDHPGYDEYRYELDTIGHNPYDLAALLTVLLEDYTRAEAQVYLQQIFDKQYELKFVEIVEQKYDEESETYYDWYVLKTILKNKTIDNVVRSFGLTADQMARYEVLCETYGNKKHLFEGDIYAIADPGEYQDYEIPAEALTNVEFANMIREAEKYLNMEYVWGGYSPTTGFDCSGFVSWVINHCGNGWNVGRQTANGLYKNTQRISSSEAKPGDLIFFEKTYNTKGASHVGIYVGNGMMLHCGNPIQYTSVNSSYWQNHFLGYGRIQ